MIPTILMLCAFLPLGSVVLDLNRDTRRQWAEETDGDNWHGADVHELPEPRMNLAFPEPVTPMDLPARDATFTYNGPSRVRASGRHRLGVAAGRETQQELWNSPTGQFWAIVEFNAALDEPCSHCAAPEDGERPHAGCPGCACPMCVEVPEVGGRPGSVHYYGRAAVFGWHIIDEAEALAWAAHLAVPGVLPAFARQEPITADAHVEYEGYADPWGSDRVARNDDDDESGVDDDDEEDPF